MIRLGTAFVLVIASVAIGSAKPMDAPTPEAAAKSPLIAVCEYVGYRNEGSKETLNGVVAEYKMVRVLRGDKAPERVRIPFHEVEGCLPDAVPAVKFTDDALPKPGSKWILFLTPIPDQKLVTHRTYRGYFGRWPATDDKLDDVQKLIEANKP